MSEEELKSLLDTLLVSVNGLDAHSQGFRAAIWDFADWCEAAPTFPTHLESLTWLDEAIERERGALFAAQNDPDERAEVATHEGRVNAYATLMMRMQLG